MYCVVEARHMPPFMSTHEQHAMYGVEEIVDDVHCVIDARHITRYITTQSNVFHVMCRRL